MASELEQLKKATADARELLAEVRGVTKDLTKAVKEARLAFAEIAEEKMTEAVRREGAEFSRLMRKHTDESEARIKERFDALARQLLEPRRREKRLGMPNMEEMVMRAAAGLEPIPDDVAARMLGVKE